MRSDSQGNRFSDERLGGGMGAGGGGYVDGDGFGGGMLCGTRSGAGYDGRGHTTGDGGELAHRDGPWAED